MPATRLVPGVDFNCRFSCQHELGIVGFVEPCVKSTHRQTQLRMTTEVDWPPAVLPRSEHMLMCSVTAWRTRVLEGWRGDGDHAAGITQAEPSMSNVLLANSNCAYELSFWKSPWMNLIQVPKETCLHSPNHDKHSSPHALSLDCIPQVPSLSHNK